MTFGTAGLRAKMGAGYCYMNDLTVIQTAQVSSTYCIISALLASVYILLVRVCAFIKHLFSVALY